MTKPPISLLRRKIHNLLDDSNPSDAPTAYYALFHPAARSELFLHEDRTGTVRGFVGRFQTGVDLFRPLVTLKCATPEIAADLLSQALTVGRPYILFAGLNQLSMVGGSLQIDVQRIMRIYIIDPTRFRPQMNVLVQRIIAQDGKPRYEIRSGDRVVSTAGINWKSPAFAEIYVQTDPAARRQGLGQGVASALTSDLLKDGIRAMYLVENGNEASVELAESLGFVDTGSRQVYADTVYLGHPT
jgi:GNAT superfamily N-acetyltransferase